MRNFTLSNRLLKYVICFSSVAMINVAQASSDPMLGDIQITGAGYCPGGHQKAEGQILPINGNQALFSLLGTAYGGDGRTTFALPDFRGRTAAGTGTGSNLNTIHQGEMDGEEGILFSNNQLPQHTHTATTVTTIHASSNSGSTSSPNGTVLADDGTDNIYNGFSADVSLSPASLASSTTVHGAGSSAANNMQPYQALTVCIATSGTFPSRN